MKKLFISVATLMFATLLFSQDDAEAVNKSITQTGVVSSDLSESAKSQNL